MKECNKCNAGKTLHRISTKELTREYKVINIDVRYVKTNTTKNIETKSDQSIGTPQDGYFSPSERIGNTYQITEELMKI